MAFIQSHLDKPQIAREDFMKDLNLAESEAEWIMQELFEKGQLELKWKVVKQK